jgi:hypothetical protein
MKSIDQLFSTDVTIKREDEFGLSANAHTVFL